jgi:hypothetical protein
VEHMASGQEKRREQHGRQEEGTGNGSSALGPGAPCLSRNGGSGRDRKEVEIHSKPPQKPNIRSGEKVPEAGSIESPECARLLPNEDPHGHNSICRALWHPEGHGRNG